jgi:hypothetical protein
MGLQTACDRSGAVCGLGPTNKSKRWPSGMQSAALLTASSNAGVLLKQRAHHFACGSDPSIAWQPVYDLSRTDPDIPSWLHKLVSIERRSQTV